MAGAVQIVAIHIVMSSGYGIAQTTEWLECEEEGGEGRGPRGRTITITII